MGFYESKQSSFGFRPNTQMNITALVDVTLVTLIIYILVSPALEHGIDIQLPQATPHKMTSQEPVVVSMARIAAVSNFGTPTASNTIATKMPVLKTPAVPTPVTIPGK